jgi:molecular chaperone GrpE (heat shock protein)
VLFRTRWALSYLRGPLTLAEIRMLRGTETAGRPEGSATDGAAAGTSAPEARGASAEQRTAVAVPAAAAASGRPVVQSGVTERFVATREQSPHYTPFIGARVRARYADSKAGLDTWQTTYYLAPIESGVPDWSRAEVSGESGPELTDEPVAGASFADAPAAVLTNREHKRWAAALEDHVYRNVTVELPSCPSLKLTAAVGMTEGEFRSRVALALREKRDAAVEALRKKYASKLATLEDRQRRAQQKIEREKSQASSQTLSSALSVGGSLLGALFGGGRRGSSISKATSAARSVGRIGKERADVEHAEADARAVREQIEAINAELEAEVARLEAEFDPAAARIEVTAVRPRKADIAVEDVALVWVP